VSNEKRRREARRTVGATPNAAGTRLRYPTLHRRFSRRSLRKNQASSQSTKFLRKSDEISGGDVVIEPKSMDSQHSGFYAVSA